jgi:hypothetical protein
VQVDDLSSFTAPLVVDQYSSRSPFAWSTFPSGTLYWRVAGRDAYGQLGPWSAVRSFSVTAPAGPLPAPSLGFPAADATVITGQPVAFTWSTVAGAATYTLQVGDSSFTAPVTINQTQVGTQYNTSTLPSGSYSWRVRANDSGGNPGAWSLVRRLTVD